MQTFIDIETIPDQSEGALQLCIDAAEPPGNYKKPESIAEWKAANAAAIGAEAWKRTALDPMRGSIAVICWAVEGGEIKGVHREPSESEADLLTKWAEGLFMDLSDGPGQFRLPRFTGWNCAEFDLRFLAIRCAIHGIKLPFALPVNQKYDGQHVCDLMRVWSGYKGFQKQSAVAKALGIKLLSDVDGSEIWDLIRTKGAGAAAEKCRSDIDALRQINSRMQPVFGC